MSKGDSKKISLKAEVKDQRVKLQMLLMYFREFDLHFHYTAFVKWKAGEGERPKNLIVKEDEE